MRKKRLPWFLVVLTCIEASGGEKDVTWWPEGERLAIVLSSHFQAVKEDMSLRDCRVVPAWVCRTAEPAALVLCASSSLDRQWSSNT